MVTSKDSICLYTAPKGKLKANVPLQDAEISPKILPSKSNALAFSVDVFHGRSFMFWSPFQKEVLEWITELRKLEYVLANGGDKIDQYVIRIAHATEDTNLTV